MDNDFEFIARAVAITGSSGYRSQKLMDHLLGVSDLAKEFANEFGNGDWASLAGFWHDLGKYQTDFQNYIRTVSGYEIIEDSDSPKRVDHSTAGAIYADQQLPKNLSLVLAYIIAGHHSGLPDYESAEHPRASLKERLFHKEFLEKTLASEPPSEVLKCIVPQTRPNPSGDFSLWVRMLFSCVVDADCLDSERFSEIEKHDQRKSLSSITISDLKTIFTKYMNDFSSFIKESDVNNIRQSVLKQAIEKAKLPSGIFTFTVPTGGGKTLSSMAFALNHAELHKKKRIIYVIPYTSIIEQTADVYRRIFGETVVEHHSNLDPEKESQVSKLATENWDAPIIVTTAVQFFESLFSARTSQARKLHNIVNSVVILDEAQLLPLKYLKPIIHYLQNLSDNYGVTLVLCTATQPALNEFETPEMTFHGLKSTTEIIDSVDSLFQSLKRISVSIPDNLQQEVSWNDLAERLDEHMQVLCVVNSRGDCRKLFKLMPKDTLHLSALMCGEHRSQVISKIKEKLAKGEEIRVISTQLVEAGVDIDFPVVYRAMAGLDSLAQAAGRCNREGKLDKGEFYVFVPEGKPPIGDIRKSQATAILEWYK